MNKSAALKKSLAYFNNDDLAASVFVTKYALTDSTGKLLEATPEDMHRRLAAEFARIESKYDNPMTEKEIFSLLDRFRYVVPQGSPMAGIGNPHQVQSISNCFVIDSPEDSYGGILKSDQELVQIAKRRGGIGFDISTIRPKGLNTANAARTTDGIEVFMDRFSNSCREVAQGGRRGALMMTISVHHPQIRDFIKIKRKLTRVTGANISIRLTDEFMNAVKNDTDMQLRFPVDKDAKHTVTMHVSATQVWNEMIESAHASAEPGLLFWDNAKRMTPSDIYENEGFGSVSTNPCGEIILSPYDSCRLMLVNLTSFVKDQWTAISYFDYNAFAKVVQKAQRLMDDMIDLEVEQIDAILAKVASDPESDPTKAIEVQLWTRIRQQALRGRRTGLGITGLGDTMAMLGIRYGSDESITETEKIYKWLSSHAYISSMNLAKERGAFEVHNPDRETDHPFLERIFNSIDEMPSGSMDVPLAYKARQMNQRWGRRNIAITTTAPAGSVSVLTQTTSGIEPAFMLHYTRRRKVADGEQHDFIDDVGDRWKEYDVYHHKFNEWIASASASGTPDELIDGSPYIGATANNIDWVQKVKMQAAAQKWVCHAISNTTNVPENTSVETIKDIYTAGWESGCKGVTVYRDNCRSGVLVGKDTNSAKCSDGFVSMSAPKRPEFLACHIHHATIQGEKWTILVGLMDEKPYEIIGGLSEYVEIPRKYREGRIKKNPRKSMNSIYDLAFGENGDEIILKNIVALFDNPNYSSFTRMISLGLRHGAPIQYVVEQLQKDKDADLFSFSKVVARVLKNYIINGTRSSAEKSCLSCGATDSFAYQEGCITCSSCGWSKCS
jgi:ribonucleoside-diphosphate reductase alpha chain